MTSRGWFVLMALMGLAGFAAAIACSRRASEPPSRGAAALDIEVCRKTCDAAALQFVSVGYDMTSATPSVRMCYCANPED